MVKFFSNFDTNLDLKLFRHYVDKYTEQQCLLVRRDKLFFIFRCVVPAFFLLLFTIGVIVATITVDFGSEGSNLMKNIAIRVVRSVITLYASKSIITNAIDYKLDFAIATPHELVAYNQTGLFKRSGQTVDVSKIKTVTVNKSSIINSIFNIGTIVILSEGDMQGNGDVEIDFVHNPDKVAQQMKDIFNLTR